MLAMTVYNKERAKKVNEAAKKIGKTAKVHIAVDTGMTRIGFSPDAEAVNAVCEINKLDNISFMWKFYHLISSPFKRANEIITR